jgi:WD40 repeat protein
VGIVRILPNEMVTVWDGSRRTLRVKNRSGLSTSKVKKLKYSNGEFMISYTNFGEFCIWSVFTFESFKCQIVAGADAVEEKYIRAHPGADITCLTELPNGMLATAASDGKIKLWELRTCECKLVLEETKACSSQQASANKNDSEQSVNSVEYIKLFNKKFLISINQFCQEEADARNKAGFIRVWDFNACKPIGEAILLDEKCTQLQVISNKIYVGTLRGRIDIYQISGDCKKINLIDSLMEHTLAITTLKISMHKNNAHKFLISASLDGTAKIWNLNEHSCLKTLDHNGGVYLVRIFSNGQLMTASLDGLVQIWTENFVLCQTIHNLNGCVQNYDYYADNSDDCQNVLNYPVIKLSIEVDATDRKMDE